MHSRDGFLATIRATPDDDAPRLVFSDWLEDHGDLARAEFIRVQCELARLGPRERRYHELTWRAEALLVENRGRWLAELPGLDGVEWLDFERGFVSTVRVLDVRILYRHDRAIAAAAPVYRAEIVKLDEGKQARPWGTVPWLRALRLQGLDTIKTDATDSLLANVGEITLTSMNAYHATQWLTQHDLPELKVIRLQGSHTAGTVVATWVTDHADVRPTRLELGTRFVDYNSGYFEDPTLGPEGTQTLAQAANLGDLEALNLNRQRVGPQGLQALLTSPHLGKLRELELRAGQLAEVTALEGATGTPLVRLDLSLNQIGERGAQSLAKSRRLAQLERLDLDTCEITAKGLAALTRAPFWQTLRQLDLSRNPLGAAGAMVLAEAAEPQALHALSLVDCDLDAAALKPLARAAWLRNLLSLDLSDNPLAGQGLERLAGGAVRALTLTGTGLDATTAGKLDTLLRQLVSLDLSNNALTDAGVVALFGSATAPDLLALKLANCQLTRKGLGVLSKEKRCPRLATLDLSGNPLTVAGVELLLGSAVAGSVQTLTLRYCSLNAASAEHLANAASLANCSVLDLRGNEFGETGLLALARSKHLAGTTLHLSGNPWVFKEPTRKLLEDRFGKNWYYDPAEDEDEFDDEDFADDEDDEA